MSRLLAVTGITGHSGRSFLKELEEHQYRGTIRCLVRKTSDTSLLDRSPLSIEKLTGDYHDEKTLKSLIHGADAVVHISNIHQSVDVLTAAVASHVSRIVMVHTTGVYSRFKAASAEYIRIESKVDRILKSSSIDCTILRPTMIFGDMCDHNISKFIRMADRYPMIPEINGGQGRIRPVNARDLAKAYYAVLMTDHLPRIYYDLSGERSLTIHELFDKIGEGLGKEIHRLNCPVWLGSFGARAVRGMTFGRIDLVEKVLRMSEDRDYGHEQAARDFGYLPEAFDVGLGREIEEYLRNKKVDR